MFSILKTRAVPFGAILFCALLTQFASAQTGGPPCNHATDGIFGGGEWNCSSVSKQFFAPAAGAGGSFLYVDQGRGPDNTLYLMYDYVLGIGPANFFDVFFEVIPENQAYLVRIHDIGGFEAFERPIGSIAPLDGNGSFFLGLGSGWDALDAADLLLARFQGAVGFGPSPNNSNPHPMAEFQLSISQPGGHSGLYDPAPAFWGASEKSAVDPPISSGIFTLNPDGSTTIVPVLGPNGAPLQQGSVTPEPGAWLLFVSGAVALSGFRRLKRPVV